MLKNKASCFIDAVEIAFDLPTKHTEAGYKALLPKSNPDEDGYHPSVVNTIIFMTFGFGLAEIDALPVNESGVPIDEDRRIAGVLKHWFDQEGFSAVVQGPRIDNDQEHAVAFRGGKFIDPATSERSDTPSVRIRSVWVLRTPYIGGFDNVPSESA